MSRKYVDCRDQPASGKKCSMAFTSDDEQELVEVVTQHAVAMHGFKDSPELRAHIRGEIKTGSPRQ